MLCAVLCCAAPRRGSAICNALGLSYPEGIRWDANAMRHILFLAACSTPMDVSPISGTLLTTQQHLCLTQAGVPLPSGALHSHFSCTRSRSPCWANPSLHHACGAGSQGLTLGACTPVGVLCCCAAGITAGWGSGSCCWPLVTASFTVSQPLTGRLLAVQHTQAMTFASQQVDVMFRT